jgi:hypothetical protein
MLHNLRFSLFKMPFISYCYLVRFLYYSHFKYRVCQNLKENSGAKGLRKRREVQNWNYCRIRKDCQNCSYCRMYMELWAAAEHNVAEDCKLSGRYSSSLLGSVLFFLGLTSSGVKETVPPSLDTVERLCLGSSLPAGSASAILIRELTACLATRRTISCQILRARGSGVREIGIR